MPAPLHGARGFAHEAKAADGEDSMEILRGDAGGMPA
jgi:hypothetical protein